MTDHRTHYDGDGCPEHPVHTPTMFCDGGPACPGAEPTDDRFRLSGDGGFRHADFAEPRPHGNVHIIQTVTCNTAVMACGKAWWLTRLRPGNGDWPNQCAKCWDTF